MTEHVGHSRCAVFFVYPLVPPTLKSIQYGNSAAVRILVNPPKHALCATIVHPRVSHVVAEVLPLLHLPAPPPLLCTALLSF